MAHSNQIREFLLTDKGIVLQDVYVGMEGVLTGSARVAREAKDKSEKPLHKQEIEQKKLALERKRKNLEAHILELKAEFEAEEAESLKLIGIEEELLTNIVNDRNEMAISRKSDGEKKSDKS